MSLVGCPVLRLENLNVSIQAVRILRDVSLELPAGTMAGLVGRNGAGKTTLMKSVMGLLKSSSGTVHFEDHDLLAIPTHARTRLGIGYMPEDRRLIPDLTVEENVLMPAWAAGIADARRRLEKIYQLIPSCASSRLAKASSSPAASRSSRPSPARSCAAPGFSFWTSHSKASPGAGASPGGSGGRPQARRHVDHSVRIRPAALRAHGRPDHRDRSGLRFCELAGSRPSSRALICSARYFE